MKKILRWLFKSEWSELELELRGYEHSAYLELKEITDKYQELLYAVARKFPDETRHETALRYINEAEVAVLCASPTVVINK